MVHLLLLLQFLLHSPYSLAFGGSAFELFRIFLTVHQGYSFFELVLESGVFLIFHEVCIDCKRALNIVRIAFEQRWKLIDIESVDFIHDIPILVT